jgi:hypothetical protein
MVMARTLSSRARLCGRARSVSVTTFDSGTSAPWLEPAPAIRPSCPPELVRMKMFCRS